MQKTDVTGPTRAAPRGSSRALALYAFFGLSIIVAGLFVLRAQLAGYHFEVSDPDLPVQQADDAWTSPVNVMPVQRVAPAAPSEATEATEAKAEPRGIAEQLLQRVDAREITLDELLARMLARFGQSEPASTSLREALLPAIAAKRSAAYIDTLLNAAIGRGDIEPPFALTTVAGRLDTDTLLETLVLAAGEFEAAAHRAFADPRPHELRPTDSFAGLSLHYYGHPLAHDRIADANEDRASLADAEVGQVVSIPAF